MSEEGEESKMPEEKKVRKPRVSKATIKKDTKKVVDKLFVSFPNPYNTDTIYDETEEEFIPTRLSNNFRKNIKAILEDKTDLDVREKSSKEGEVIFELRLQDTGSGLCHSTSTTPLETDYITKLVYEHLPLYTEKRERKERMRTCEIKELDGKFYMFVLSKGREFGYMDTDEEIEMMLEGGDYTEIGFS